MLLICIKALYHPPFLNLHQGLISKSMQQSKVGKFRKRMKITAATLGLKYKSETMLEVIRGLVLGFVLYFVTV